MNKKGTGTETTSPIIWWIIGVLVLVLVLFVLFKADIIGYLRNVPGYSYNDTDSFVDMGSENGGKNTVCPVQIGYLVNVAKPGWWNVHAPLIFTKTPPPVYQIYIDGKKVNLIIDGGFVKYSDETPHIEYIWEGTFFENGLISINTGVFDLAQEMEGKRINWNVQNEFVTIEQLKKLDGSSAVKGIGSNTMLLCRQR